MVIALVAFVVSVAALDSLNPSTVGPALLLATRPHGLRDVLAFTAAVFTVSTAGGLALTFGPAHALLPLLASSKQHTRDIVELAVGIAFVAAAPLLWRFRAAIWKPRAGSRAKRNPALVGASIMAVELPTAVPYFGAILAIVAASRNALVEILLIVVFNIIFVVPLFGAALVAKKRGARGSRAAERANDLLYRFAPRAVPFAVAVIGTTLVLVGAIGL